MDLNDILTAGPEREPNPASLFDALRTLAHTGVKATWPCPPLKGCDHWVVEVISTALAEDHEKAALIYIPVIKSASLFDSPTPGEGNVHVEPACFILADQHAAPDEGGYSGGLAIVPAAQVHVFVHPKIPEEGEHNPDMGEFWKPLTECEREEVSWPF